MSSLVDSWNTIGKPRLLVLGDLILDRYTWGSADRVSPEAPVLVLNSDEEEIRPGGAASVAALLCGLEAEVQLAGVVGDDSAGRQLQRLLVELGIDASSIIRDPDRPTTTKERFMGRAAGRHPHQILRVDTESTEAMPTELEDQLLDYSLKQLQSWDAILVSDYAKGVCTPRLLSEFIQAAVRRHVPIIVDPARIDDYGRYAGANLITPNRSEAERACGRRVSTPHDARKAARELCDRHSFGAVVVTVDRDGMIVADSNGDNNHIPTEPREVYDITGAGDMVLAVVGLCQSASIPLVDSLQLANVAAGLEVERLGVASVQRDEIEAELKTDGTFEKLVTLADMTAMAETYRRQGKSIVFTNGCFDLLHAGHVHSLEAAAQLGDVLIVGVNSDATVAKLKGRHRPIISESDRASMLNALHCVNHVLIFDEETPHRLLQQIRPDILVKGGTTNEVVGREVVEGFGGKVVVTESVSGISTTQILQSASRCRLPDECNVPLTLQQT